MEFSDGNLVWIDLEMTGLEPEIDVVIEIATIVTSFDLSEQVAGPVLAVHQPKEVLTKMDEWNTKQHHSSGLVERVINSHTTVGAAEAATLQFLSEYVPLGVSPMCGNSVGQDRRFIYKYMPSLGTFFHYRNLDVSTLKELALRWVPELAIYQKSSAHLAMQDVQDSIDELKYYRKHLLRIPEKNSNVYGR
jgi:oligoribonuclease